MKDWIALGSCLMALAVAIGAFGAHGLKSKVSNEDLIIFETGVRYQIYHSLALIILGLITYIMPNLKLSIIGISFYIWHFTFFRKLIYFGVNKFALVWSHYPLWRFMFYFLVGYCLQ